MAEKNQANQLLTFNFESGKKLEITCDLEVGNSLHWNKIKITSSDSKLATMEGMNSVNVEYSTINLSGDIIESTEIINANIRGVSFSLGHNSIYSLFLFPQEVNVRRKLNYTSKRKPSKLTFYINKSPMIAPRTYTEPNEHGEVKQTKSKPISFNMSNSKPIKSDVLYTYNSSNGHFESDRYQILTTTIKKHRNPINFINENISNEVDDILMLLSFAHSGRISYVNWRADFNNEMIWHYRSNRLKLTDIKDDPVRELIERKDVQKFVTDSLPIYKSSIYRDTINNSIHSLDGRNSTVIELAYLSYFQALESLILTCKRSNELEYILKEKEFSELKGLIEKTINDFLPNQKEKRGKIKSKLLELNRVSLKESAELFFSEFNVPRNDIWPIFDDKKNNSVGLYTIRNRIVHGDVINSEYLSQVAIALEHLKILLTRCIFTILQWDISQTKIDNRHLNNYHNFFKPEFFKKTMEEISSHLLNIK